MPRERDICVLASFVYRGAGPRTRPRGGSIARSIFRIYGSRRGRFQVLAERSPTRRLRLLAGAEREPEFR